MNFNSHITLCSGSQGSFMVPRMIIMGLLVVLMSGCILSDQMDRWPGCWEGPHPEADEKKFIIYIRVDNNGFSGKGYWTLNGHYNSSFEVDRLVVDHDSIRFFVPLWDCNYSGRINQKSDLIEGGFRCSNEPYDPVILRKKEGIENYLLLPKPGSDQKDYQYQYRKPPGRNDKLETSAYYSETDSLFIYSIIGDIIAGSYGRINSFLLVKDERLICEEYFFGYTRDTPHQIESSTKSIISLLIGIAIDQGKITDINEPVYKSFPAFTRLTSGAYSEITLNHLLTMTAGFKKDDISVFQSTDRIAYALNRELVNPPGEIFNYDGGCTEILGGVIREKTAYFADSFADRYLFAPLGIVNYNWDELKQEGYPCAAGSLQLLPRDMAKIGILVANKGIWDSKEILSAEWLEKSTAAQTKTHIEGDDYAYQWWRIKLESGGRTYNAIWANGLGSQFIYIIPEINSVIVTTGHNYENDSWAITRGISKYLYLLDHQTDSCSGILWDGK